ncbi:pyridine nucleotide-disulfide oxidoreductase family protein [Penicillium brasilianum]|uniref:Pyridine nucleotide-disulfide oxidoreductase family protein n=1 Tax=Penicillium brasilianum TaxID=104259 RepID=A0A1S9RVV4_PENBI|nr:pyridine nucleotide-disulfide oxidoreductase family protein [Penicillium brasilianum]
MAPIQPQTLFSSTSDVTIVGGGASALAILLQLIERCKNETLFSKVVVLEKSELPGPGLAYSTSCEGTILNMHTDTMGLYHDRPKHFTQWRTSMKGGQFPPREEYGQYLQATWSQAIEEARQIGLEVSVIHEEVEDIERLDDGIFELKVKGGNRLVSQAVILCLGNFTSVFNLHLMDLPGFFPSPWPLSKLKPIPSDSAVLIVGSRLSAIDAATFLHDNGHRGTITLMSRSGSLPKVQGYNESYFRRYVLHDLAKQTESDPNEALLQIMRGLMEELSRATGGDWSWLIDDTSPMKQLQYDIHAAQTGQVQWQAVLKSTAPVIERYWKCLSPGSQELFMKEFYSMWMRFRHAMPLHNAQKILQMMKTSQLRVVHGDSVHWDGRFSADTSDGVIEVGHVIEATGQECRLNHIRSPLIQSALKKNLIKAHPRGGIAVDFDDLSAAPGLYAIGSLTRGTHFYVSAVDRIAAHAARISYSLTKQPYTRSCHVAIFCGSDLFSQLMISELVPKLLADGHVPFIYLPKHRASASAVPYELRELAFFERELLQQYVRPYFQGRNPTGATHQTIDQIRNTYGILVEDVPNINKISFVETLAEHYISVGLSIRCYQRFKTDIIRYFSQPRRLLNLHPGTLPAYRGVMTTVRAMKNKETHFGYSLHDIDENWDSGDVIEIRKHPIDYSKSMLAYMGDVYGIGVHMARDAVDKIARGRQMPKAPQDAKTSGYYTFPTSQEMQDIRDSGIRLVDADHIISIIVESFASPYEQVKFREYIQLAVQDWYSRNGVRKC